MLNYIVMMGRLTQNPELRRTQAGDAVCSFRIACDRDYKDKSGNKRYATEILTEHARFADSKPKDGGNGSNASYEPPENWVPDFGNEDGELPY